MSVQKNGGFQHPVDGRTGNAPGALSGRSRNRHPGVAKESATNGSPRRTGGMKNASAGRVSKKGYSGTRRNAGHGGY